MVTRVSHVFRGELEGEPRSKSEDGLSKRARILSTWRSRLLWGRSDVLSVSDMLVVL